jgi:CRISPR/Cas system-associated exonuclease Cas4 (RecB family)
MDKKNWHLTGYLERVVGTSRNIILPEIEAHLVAAQEARDALRDVDHMHPSDLAKTNWCPRATYYKLTSVPESNKQRLTLQRRNVLEEGHRIHEKWQTLMWKTGRLKGEWKCRACSHVWWDVSPTACASCGSESIKYHEVAIKDPKHMIIGHADGIVQFDVDYVVEIKSVGLGTLRWEAPSLYSAYETGELNIDEVWKRIKRPIPAHNRQVQLYMHCLGIPQALVIYEWKPTQDVKEFNVKFSPDVVKPMLDGAKEVMNALEDEITPRRPQGFSKSNECRFCAYKDACWS